VVGLFALPKQVSTDPQASSLNELASLAPTILTKNCHTNVASDSWTLQIFMNYLQTTHFKIRRALNIGQQVHCCRSRGEKLEYPTGFQFINSLALCISLQFPACGYLCEHTPLGNFEKTP
jgi:hypothetical protein